MTARTKHPKYLFRKLARIHDRASGRYTDLYEFPVAKDELGRLEISRSIAHEPRKFAAELRDHGALLPLDEKECKKFVKSVATSRPENKWTYAAEVGWLNEGWQAYVQMECVIGSAPAKIVGVKRSNTVSDTTGKISRSGTAESWREVAQRAQYSSIFMLATCASFSGPLLRALKCRSFGINIFGPSRIGKTVATLIGASVTGFGKVDDLISWGITDARFRERLPEFNDTLLPVEDLMKLEGTDRQKFRRVQSFAYAIEQGHQSARHSSFTERHGGAHRSYRTILLTSCERSIAEFAELAKSTLQGGGTVRLIDVPASLGGQPHLFDRLAEPMDPVAFSAWKTEQFSSIPLLIAESHGTVFEQYIEGLITTGRDKITNFARRRIAEFEKHVCEQTDGDLARDAAVKFGLLYSAGRVAIKLKLLPWSADSCLDAIAKCYFAARELLPDSGVALRRSIQKLVSRLKALPKSEGLARNTDYDTLMGFRSGVGGVEQCVIKCEAFNRIFSTAGDRKLVLDRLIEQNRIVLAASKDSASGVQAKPKEQFPWPDGKRRRSFEIRWPTTATQGKPKKPKSVS